MAYIYKTTNNITGELYIGATTHTPKKRFIQTISESKTKCRQNCKRPILEAIRHYGEENFTYECIEECDKSILYDREKYWIKKLNTSVTGYNISLGGAGNLKIDREYLESEIKKLNSVSKVSEATGYTKESIRIFRRKNNLQRGEDVKRQFQARPVKGTIPSGEIKQFQSIYFAAKYCKEQGMSQGKISTAQAHIVENCKGKRKFAYGVKWEYL